MYKSFNKYLLRTPAFSYHILKNIDRKTIPDLMRDPLISEAIYVSSPEFHREMVKCAFGSQEFSEKMFSTLLKYLVRMSTRCTPFGLFCGVSIGKKGPSNKIFLNENTEHKRVSKFDMDFLCSLSQQLSSSETLINTLRYFPNNSLYPIGERLRYVDSRYTNNLKKNVMASIDNSYHVEQILKSASKGLSVQELANIITDKDISIDDATEFIHALIEEQIIVSSIYPHVTGPDYFLKLKNELGSEYDQLFCEIEFLLKEINNDKLSGTEDFRQNHLLLHDLLRDNRIDFDEKVLVQTDLIMSCRENELGEAIFSQVDAGLKVLNKLSKYYENDDLADFKEEFYRRYEDREVPLSVALDVEAGIGYPPMINEIYELSPLVDDLFVSKEKRKKTNTLNKKDRYLNSKLAECLQNKKKEIVITDSDLLDFEENWDNLPATFSVFINVLDDSNLIKINEVGNATATSVLGRFSNIDAGIEKFTREITEKESVLIDEGEILCEIAHLPEKSLGNILSRPCIREFEIPYLAKSNLPVENQITIDDIFISVKDNELILRSKKLNKIILPRLATAHNFTDDNLPVYLFLCEMQCQKTRDHLTFNWGNIYMLYDFLPRVVYGNIILSPSIWHLQKKLIEQLKQEKDISEWRRNFSVPNKIFIKESDIELFIDFENELMIKVFLSEIKNKDLVTIVEYVFDDNSPLVKNKNNQGHTNEILISYHKSTDDDK